MRIATLVLLAAGIAGTVARPRRIPVWLAPALAASLALGIGSASLAATRHVEGVLAGPLAFLLAAVPLALMVDRLGFFESVADRMTFHKLLVPGLWAMAALVTTVLNLDAAVVLLTPLYVRVAQRAGLSPRAVAFQPVILALLASSALPVSNLTNLIASSHTGAGPAGFLAHLGPPSLVATAVGYWCYRRAMPPGAPRPPVAGAASSRGLVSGGVVLALVLAGFVGGPSLGIQPWEVALGADAALIVMTRDVPLGSVPWGTALVAASLAVLATASAQYLPVAQLVSASGVVGLLRTAAVSAGLANLVNNLPTLLVVLPAVHHGASWQLWALLVGVNMGPMLLVTGSLASLLWMESVGRLGVEVGRADYFRAGLRIGLPSLAAATGMLLVLRVALGSP